MNRRITLALLLLTAATLVGVPQALAIQSYLDNFNATYPLAVGSRIDNCLLCHVNPSPSTQGADRNPYGTAFGANGHNFTVIEPSDSDGDGFTNINEIHNLTFPGNASDFPPIITSFSPASPVTSNLNGPAVTFTVKVNQPASVTWFLDGVVNKQENTNATNESSDSITPSSAGTHNVSAVALKAGDGSTMQTWVWNVTQVQKNGSISGMKFNDTNGDGARQANEEGLMNWTLVLTKPGGTTETAITDSSGNYSFKNLSAGTYTVGEILKPNWKQTAPSTGTYTVTITSAGENVTGRDFGNMLIQQTFNISGFKINASSGSGIPGWNITITNTIMKKSMQTGADGSYKFTGLVNGTYTITEEMQSGFTNVSPTSVQVIINGADATNVNFTNTPIVGPRTFNISGFKINASSGSGIPGWNITIKNTTMQKSMQTGSDGSYKFTDLANGTYNVSEEMKPGFTPVGATFHLETIENMDVMNVNFTNQPVGLGSISGMKFNDTNGDGVRQANEEGLANWTIVLTKPDGTTETTMTDSSGNYTFTNLSAGTYTVGEVLKPNWTQTAPPTGKYTLTLAPGENATDKNFGNMLAVGGSISGFKVNDTNGNGMRDANETGLPNWTIRLIGITGTGIDTKVIRKETITDAQGFYEFNNLPAGRYIIVEKMQRGFIPISPPVKNIQLASNQSSTDNNFFNRPVSSLIR